MLAIRSILHPTDFSERSQAAFQMACSLARDYGVPMTLMHAVPSPTVMYGEGMIPPLPEGYVQEQREKLYSIQAPDPTIRMKYNLAEGDPATEILRVAREMDCDLIVLGTHGRTGLNRLLMGSVAELVMRKAPCPVLTMKTPFPGLQTTAATVKETAGEPLEVASH
jgi:nucleotide-binding universal stress UspA family protein